MLLPLLKNGLPVMDTVYNRPIMTLQFVPKAVDGDLMFIDEAGTVPEDMKADILSKGIKIIATGDLAQLPPVIGKSAFLNDPNIPELTKIMRQGEGSDILYIADRARRGLPIHPGVYGNVLVIYPQQLNNRMIMSSNVILCGTNKTRDAMNKRVREDLLGINSDLPVNNDRVVCRNNNWQIAVDGINLANGLAGIVTNNPTVRGYKNEVFTMDFRPFLLDSSFKDLECDYKYLNAKHIDRQTLKMDRYRQGEKFEYGYALTTHMAQGAQYNNGIYISEYMGKDIQKNIDYTGPTRFIKSMIYVIPDNGKTYF
jgi:exodeoxyribonuclease-5